MSTDKNVASTAIRIKGHQIEVESLKVAEHEIVITGRFPRMCCIKDEWYHEVHDARVLVQDLHDKGPPADLFTFIIRPPSEVTYDYYRENDNVAVLELDSYDHWWTKRIDSAARGHVRKSRKSGVNVRTTDYSETLLAGIEKIYDETPLRQGKPFWHYRKGLPYLDEVHRTFLDRSDFIGAYVGDELVGFIKLVYAGDTASLMHIIAMMKHRNKAVTNGLLAKAVEVACQRGVRYLVYDKYDYEYGGSASLLQFKRNNGFVKLEYPRYFVPLTNRGHWILRCGMQHGVMSYLPKGVVHKGVELRDNLRRRWYERKHGLA